MKNSFGKLCLAIFPVALILSCASTPKESGPVEENESTVSIKVNKKKNDTYFFSISDENLSLAREGSPSSLKSLASKMHRVMKTDYSDREIVLLNISSFIMSKVWPSESFSVDVQEADFYNPYTPLINSMKNGVFDTGSSESDFFTNLIPTVLLTKGGLRSEFYGKAQTMLEKALAEQNDSTVANYIMALLQLELKNPENALLYLSKAEKLGSVVEINKAKSRAYFMLGDYDKTVEFAKTVLEFLPQDQQSLEFACRSLIYQERWNEASKYSTALLQIAPENVDYVLMKTRILVFTGEHLKASTLLDTCARTTTTHKDYLFLQGWLQKNWSKNISAAADTMSKAVTLYPDDGEILLLAAQVASSSGTKIGGYSAFELIQKVLDENKNDIDVLKIYYAELIQEKRYSEVYSGCQELLDGGCDDDDIWFSYIDSCIGLGKNSDALKVATKLYQEKPENEKIQQAYLKSLVASGKRKEALDFIKEKEPDSSNLMKSFMYYEKSLIDSGYDAIQEDLKTSLSFNARNVDALYSMYKIQYANKNWKLAQFYLKQVAAIKPNDPDIQSRIAELERLVGK